MHILSNLLFYTGINDIKLYGLNLDSITRYIVKNFILHYEISIKIGIHL